MYMRIFRAPAHPGTLDEIASRMASFIATTLRGSPGLLHVYFGGERSLNQMTVVSLWENEQTMNAASPKVQAFARQIQDLLTEPPAVLSYEVMAQL